MRQRRARKFSLALHEGDGDITPIVITCRASAAACAVLAREHGEPDATAMVLDSLGLGIADLEISRTGAYDVEALRPQQWCRQDVGRQPIDQRRRWEPRA